jgi:hypothetical protein
MRIKHSGKLSRVASALLMPAIMVACGGGDGAASTVTQPTALPVITTQPVAVSVAAPAAAVFSVPATSALSITYQWQRNGAAIANATASTYALQSTSPSDSGADFTVRVSNSAGSIESAAARLTVTAPSVGVLSSQKLQSSGIERDYLLYTPANLPAGPVPLVVVLHGGSQDAAKTASEVLPTFAWRLIAEREKILVAFPNGLMNQWNDCRSDTTNRTSANDTAFVSDLIAATSGHISAPTNPRGFASVKTRSRASDVSVASNNDEGKAITVLGSTRVERVGCPEGGDGTKPK